jgi:hypothetical protein
MAFSTFWLSSSAKKLIVIISVLSLSLNGLAQSVMLKPDAFKDSSIIQPTVYKGKKALRFADIYNTHGGLAILKDMTFLNGTIELEVAGRTLPDADTTVRGFIGIAFRVQSEKKFECIYLRPSNGRANDQLRRNHSTQYIAIPGYPWYVLRNEAPGVYESYVDLRLGEWTKMRIEVSDGKASLYVGKDSQPCLIINDLKAQPEPGSVALWIGNGTDGYFRKLVIREKKTRN